ncbi:hypothetical protein BSKO_11720 [Bryopsis sp. KO-2023]|nr:hypothetical protein BSKO_11720 [Bryopsis sp. KO-2023]
MISATPSVGKAGRPANFVCRASGRTLSSRRIVSACRGRGSRCSIKTGAKRFSGARVVSVSRQKRAPPQTKCPDGVPMVSFYCRRRGSSLIVSAVVSTQEDAPTFLEDIPENDSLVKGQLENGMRYVIFPNKTPPNRFEAHLEVHAGSVDETEEEQGLAHLVEHVTFLGSRKREGLLGTGARSNAYTDFHHTVFHVHSPLVNATSGKAMLPMVLDALKEIAFAPQFMYSRIEKERRAVLSEAQMMNTIEYRVDCQLLKYLHQENALGDRFPIGKTDQIKTWKADMLKKYWYKWYFPANTTLYVVGQLEGGVEATKELIENIFSDVEPGVVPGKKILDDKLLEGPEKIIPSRSRHEIRPPVEHVMGCGPLSDGENPMVPVSIFRHPLLQHFMLSVFCKLPVRPIRTRENLKEMLMLRTILSVLHFRINARYSQQDPPFIGIEVDISDSGREGCCVSTLTVTSEPGDWRGAVRVALQELRRVQMYGIKPGELKRYMAALIRDSEQAADLADSIPSVENLEYLMESIALEHKVMEQKDMHELMLQVQDEITIENVNAMCRSMLSFTSDYGRETELLDEAEKTPEDWAEPGPTRATAIIACVPSFMDVSGASTGGAAPMQRGMSMVPNDHVDVDMLPEVETSQDEDEFEIPEGAVRFEISEEDIQAALMDRDIEVEAQADIDVPDDLLSKQEIEKLIEERQPCYVNVENASPEDPTVSKDPATNIVQRRLSNGIRLNYVYADNEPKTALLRMVVPGGKFQDETEPGPSGMGATAIGTRALSESGTVGPWSREQTELFCVSRLINCMFESSDEFLVMDFNFPVGGGGLAAVLQVLHLFLESPRWEDSAVARAKQIYASNFRTQQKSLEGATIHRLRSAMFGKDHRFMDPSPEEVEVLTLEGMRDLVTRQLTSSGMEINIVGDIDAAEVDDAILKYLGTIKAGELTPLESEKPLSFSSNIPPTVRHQVWHLQDSDERACAYISGAAPSRWNVDVVQPNNKVIPPVADPTPDPTGKQDPMQTALARSIRRMHPLYPSTVYSLLMEVINSRLFTTVRDQLGLTYDVSFDLAQFDRQQKGWWTVHVTSSPEKVGEALTASVGVLKGFKTNPINAGELARARRTLITRHESDLRTNAYWVGLLTHLQSDQVVRKSVDCLRDIVPMLKTVHESDIQEAYDAFDFEEEFYTCLGTSGKVAPSLPANQAFQSSSVSEGQIASRPIWDAIMKAAQAVKDGNPAGNEKK